MRKKKLVSNSIYQMCTLSKCNVKLISVVKTKIPIEKVSKYSYKFDTNITDEMILGHSKSSTD